MTDARTGTFIATKEQRRFTECAEADASTATLARAAARLASANLVRAPPCALGPGGPLIETWPARDPSSATIHAAFARSRTVFHTPPVLGTLRDLRATLNDHIMRVEVCIDDHLQRDVQGCRVIQCQPLVELLIFDEAERLSMTALACIRDLFDRTGVGVILIGMPGMEKRLSRSATLQPCRLRPSLPPLAGRRTLLRADPALAKARPDSR
jgi:hypothetical protein